MVEYSHMSNGLFYLYYSDEPENITIRARMHSSGLEAGYHAKRSAFGLQLIKETFIKSCYSTY
jgi:hypothetical protein